MALIFAATIGALCFGAGILIGWQVRQRHYEPSGELRRMLGIQAEVAEARRVVEERLAEADIVGDSLIRELRALAVYNPSVKIRQAIDTLERTQARMRNRK